MAAYAKVVSPRGSRSASNTDRGQAFGKELRVRLRRDFLRIQRRGRRRHTANFIVIFAKRTPGAVSRIGFSVSRRVGNAVVRNRVKRRLREFFRIHRQEWPSGCDTVVIAKPGAATLSYAELVEELRVHFSI